MKEVLFLKIGVSYDTIGLMLEIFKGIKEGKADREEIEKILQHRDYCVEFERYNGRVSREEFVEFLINFKNLNPDEIKNKDLKVRYNDYNYLHDNIDNYIREYENLKKYTLDIFEKQVNFALKGLPDDFEFDELNFIFTIGIGMSFGWAHKSFTHYDFIMLARDNKFEDFMSVLSHEVHHIAMNSIQDSIGVDNFTPEEYFYVCFTGEGLAVKYCNNAEGNLSKKIYDGEANIGLDKFSWNYLNNDFDETFKMFKKHIAMIRNGDIKDAQGVENLFFSYWMDSHTKDQDKSEVGKLKQLRLYSFGNELWGVIHDVFGKEKVFETIKNPKEFPSVFNAALKAIGKEEYII